MTTATQEKKGEKPNRRNKAYPGMSEEERRRRYAHNKFKIAEILEAIKGSSGKKTIVARRLGCTSHAIYQWVEKYPEVAQAFETELQEYRDKMLDLGMSNVMALLLTKDGPTSRWVLDRLGAKAGFVPKQALTDPDGEQPYTMTVNINVDDSKIKDASD